MKFILRIFLFFLVIQNQNIYAQKINYKRFSENDGLTNSYIYCIKQDKNHFLWVATAEGLARFDGRNFITFSTKNGLAENFVNTLFIDSKDQKWIGHYSGGITLFDDKRFKILDSKKHFLSRINRFFENKIGEIFVCTQSDGLWKVNQDLSFQQISQTQDDYPIIFDMEQLNENQYVLATNEGVIFLEYNIITKKYQQNILKDTDLYSVISILKIKNEVLLATEYDGIFKLDINKENKDIFILKKIEHKAGEHTSEKIVFIDKDSKNHIYISYENGSFTQNKLFGNSIEQSTSYNISNEKFATFCKSMLIDIEDDLWIGTFGNGLMQSSGNVFLSYANQFEFTQENINALAIKNNIIYFAIQNELFIYDIQNETYSQLTYKIVKEKNNSEQIKYILLDDNNNIYVSIENKGIYVSSLKKLNFKEFFCHQDDRPSCTISCMTLDDNNNLWLATENGAYAVNLTTKTTKRIGIENGLPHNNIYTITNDSQNRIWFATHSSGISYFENGKLFKLHSPIENFAVNISTIYEDKQQNIWFGTYGRGIMRFNNGKFDKQFSKKEGMGSDFCYTFSEDKNGFLWVGHKNGFSKINIETSEINYYENNSEYSDAEVNLNTVCKENDSEIWYGTNHGLIKFDAENDRKNIIENSNVITSMKLFFNEPQWNTLNAKRQITSPQQNLHFKYNQNHITFEFIGISLKSPENVKYKFYLEGFENNWSLETKQNYATYSNLPPGDFTFKLISKNKDGKWNKNPATYAFKIDTPFWYKWWFVLISTVLFLSLIFAVYYYRTLNLRKKNVLLFREKKKLEHEISERKIMERKLNESQRLLQLSNEELNEFMWRLYHDLKGPLKTIRGLVNIAQSENADSLSLKKYFGLIGITTDKLDSILTDFSKIKILTDFDFSHDLINFEDIVYAVIDRLKSQYGIPSVNLIIENKLGNNQFYTDYSSLEMILNNVLKNSLIYSKINPQIKVRIKPYDNYITILISDNGIGIEKAAITKVFNMFYRATEQSKGSGLGLYITKKYVDMMNGRMSIYSKKGNGTTLMLQLPSIPPV